MMEWNGMEGKGREYVNVPLFGYKNSGWNGMEDNGMDSISFHHLFFFPPQFGGMGWNPHFLITNPLYSTTFYSTFQTMEWQLYSTPS